MFQSTPSRRGRRERFSVFSGKQMFQSTPSRRGRLIQLVSQSLYRLVSIHSLTQRETFAGLFLAHSGMVSIHSLTQRETSLASIGLTIATFQSTPSRRGRLYWNLTWFSRTCFNPLPHAEGDILRSAYRPPPKVVSIHSLTQRETLLQCKYITTQVSFNPLPHAEGDSKNNIKILF